MFRTLFLAAAMLTGSLWAAGAAEAGCSCGGGTAAAGPPSAPAAGYTYRSYSVQPQVFVPSRGMYWSSRPGMSSQNQIINRRLRPGTYSFH